MEPIMSEQVCHSRPLNPLGRLVKFEEVPLGRFFWTTQHKLLVMCLKIPAFGHGGWLVNAVVLRDHRSEPAQGLGGLRPFGNEELGEVLPPFWY